jgi:glucose-1-phosphate thymidylyltransferase
MRCFILAGGFATRLWPLTERRAKPLLPIAGKPIISYLIEQVPEDIPVTVSTNAVFADDFREWKKGVGRKNLDVLIEDTGHEDQKLGALGAVAQWIKSSHIDDDLLLLAGDNYAAINLRDFLALRKDQPLLAAHDIADPELAKQFGTIIVKEGAEGVKRVISFEEKPLHPKSTFVSTGWWYLPKTCLSVLCEYAASHPDNVGGIFEEFLRREIPVDCFTFHETWRDIGSFDSYLSLHRELLSERQIIDPSTTTTDATLEGSVVVGPKCLLQKSTIRDCIIFGNTRIQDCVLERCIIDENCSLTGLDLTDKMVRANTVFKNRISW